MGVESQPRRSYEAGELIEFCIECPRPGVRAVVVDGEIDLLTAPLLRAVMAEQLSHGCERLVLDLDGVQFLGSAGLAVLVAGQSDAERLGCQLCLVYNGRAVARALVASGLDGLFLVYPSMAEAAA
ncbi:STAS domain-containing protein [Longimycelium tulufanense]|uniref:STAS domain-containing protein n=1 Tax=Longimycelium tulufanense TaxID=907463 RepID=UPI001662FFDD|nr:STAS domain-containing protein [Longimycelium tulufanense]